MSLATELIADVNGALSFTWNIRDGTVVPDTDDVALVGGAVRLRATMLYADLSDSTELAMNVDSRVVARYFKAFLAVSSRLIRARGGHIRSFDGDRVMGVFLGSSKNTSAMKCALNINWVFTKVIEPKFKAKYDSLNQRTLGHCVGVDTSEVLVVRAGIRGSNDLVWVGRAPNVAAKLSGIREPGYSSYVSPDVYDVAHDSVKVHEGQAMWEKRGWQEIEELGGLFRSSWTWEP